MLTNEDLQALSNLMDKKLEPINSRLDNMDQRLDKVDQRLDKVDQRLDKVDQRLDKVDQRLDRMEEDIAIIKEDGQITREVTNDIGEWVDYYFHEDKPYPIDKEEIEKQKEIMRFAK